MGGGEVMFKGTNIQVPINVCKIIKMKFSNKINTLMFIKIRRSNESLGFLTKYISLDYNNLSTNLLQYKNYKRKIN